MKYIAHFDGSITVNPGGIMGIAYIIYEKPEFGEKREVFKHSEILKSYEFPNGTSNNIAECIAADKLLFWFIKNNLTDAEIEIYGDSEIIINRLKSKGFCKKVKGLYAPFMIQTITRSLKFPNIKFKWVPREANAEADAISR